MGNGNYRIVVLLVPALFVSCDIFQTRTADPPAQTSSSYVSPVVASDVFDNMRSAFQDQNPENYLKSFSDSATFGRTFVFDASPQARSQYFGVFIAWTKQSEQEYFTNMNAKILAGKAAGLSFTTLSAVSEQSDSAQYDAEYLLTVPHSQAGIPTVFQGRAQFFLIRNSLNSTWSIWHWVDFRDAQNDPGWSDLKGAFAQ
ncbi:MAG TPA: hypothetical protein VI758_12120 [Bacteroidota bacterium]